MEREKADTIITALMDMRWDIERLILNTPHGDAKMIETALLAVDEVAAELGLGEFMGRCWHCESLVFSEDDFNMGDEITCGECLKKYAAAESGKE